MRVPCPPLGVCFSLTACAGWCIVDTRQLCAEYAVVAGWLRSSVGAIDLWLVVGALLYFLFSSADVLILQPLCPRRWHMAVALYVGPWLVAKSRAL